MTNFVGNRDPKIQACVFANGGCLLSVAGCREISEAQQIAIRQVVRADVVSEKNLSRFSPIKKSKKKGGEEKKGRDHLVIRTPMSKWFGWSVSSGFNLSAHAAKLANVSSALGLMDKSIYGKTILKWIGTILWSRVYGWIFVSRFLTLSLRGRQRKNQIFQQPKVQQLYTLPITELL